MRQTVMVAATTALVSTIVAIWGTTVIQKHSANPAAATSIDVMKMMREAKGLPEESYEAN
jgi:hypothetical protein